MGVLLRFSPKTGRSASAPPASGQGGATVLMFTGVRYERAVTANAKPVRQRRRTRKG